MDIRIGHGYDCHRLVQGRRLILGGVEIPFEMGLLGHSDADCLIHAICDALLGAAALGDIGHHFPPTDPAFKDISSMILLDKVKGMLKDQGLRPQNIDATVVCEAPRLSPFIPDMVRNIQDCLGLEKGQVNVKATTTEGIGFHGEGIGVSAFAVVLIKRC